MGIYKVAGKLGVSDYTLLICEIILPLLSENDAEVIPLGNNNYRFVPKDRILDRDGDVLKEFEFKVHETHILSAAVESVAIQIIRKKLKLRASHTIEVIKE